MCVSLAASSYSWSWLDVIERMSCLDLLSSFVYLPDVVQYRPLSAYYVDNDIKQSLLSTIHALGEKLKELFKFA